MCLTFRRESMAFLSPLDSIAAAASSPAMAAMQTTASTYDVRFYGAVDDGTTLNTGALQAAIDQCSPAGGGIVVVAGGHCITGTLYLKSNICLRVESGAAILGSTSIADCTTDTDRTIYCGEPYMYRCLIFAKDVQNISIEGQGTIDGQGASFPERGDHQSNRPKLM